MAYTEEDTSVDQDEEATGEEPTGEVDDVFDNVRIVGAEPAADVVPPGRSVFATPADSTESPPVTPTGTDEPSLVDDPLDLRGAEPPPTEAVPPVVIIEPDDASLPSWTTADPVSPAGPAGPAVEASSGSSEGDPGEGDLSAWAGLPDAAPRWADSDMADVPVPVAEDAEDFFEFDDTTHEPLEEFHQRAGSNAPPRIDEPNMGRPNVGASTATPAAPRDMNQALITGVGLAVVAIAALLLGEPVALVFVTVLLAISVAEFYLATRRAGYQPASLLGIAATVSLNLAVYWRFEAAIPLVLFLSVVFVMLWFLTGPEAEAPVLNIGVTMLGIIYIGMLGSFAGLMLSDDNGIGLLLAAVLVTIGYDVGGLVVGRAMGKSPLSSASPNKTIEGLVGGMVSAVLVAVVVVGLFSVKPFGDSPGGMLDALILGLVAAVAAPLGDLCESLLKRDLGIKDMGNILPGHGGLLDRFDAMLFVLPATYYTARLLDLLSA